MVDPGISSSSPGSEAVPATVLPEKREKADIGGLSEADSSRKRQKIGSDVEHQEVRIRTEAPSSEPFELSIPRAWLRSEYFEAKLERWSGSTGEPAIIFELPEGSDPEKGVTILKTRLGELAAGDEVGKAWDPIRWWHATDGSEAAFRTCLYLFDLVLLEDMAKEVIAAMQTFLVECFGTFETVAKKYSDTVLSDGGGVAAAKSPLKNVKTETLKHMLEAAVKDTKGSARFLADRAIAGRGTSAKDDEELMDMLLTTFLSAFRFKKQIENFWCSGENVVFEKQGSLLQPAAIPWLKRCMRHLLARCPQAASKVVPAILNAVTTCQPAQINACSLLNPKGKDREEWVDWDSEVLENLALFFTDLIHALLLESYRLRNDATRLESIAKGVADITEVFSDKTALALSDARLYYGHSIFQKHCSQVMFAVAPACAQKIVMSALRVSQLRSFLKDHAQCVHADLRHKLLDHLAHLSEKAQQFLATADFPGLETAREGD